MFTHPRRMGEDDTFITEVGLDMFGVEPGLLLHVREDEAVVPPPSADPLFSAVAGDAEQFAFLVAVRERAVVLADQVHGFLSRQGCLSPASATIHYLFFLHVTRELQSLVEGLEEEDAPVWPSLEWAASNSLCAFCELHGIRTLIRDAATHVMALKHAELL